MRTNYTQKIGNRFTKRYHSTRTRKKPVKTIQKKTKRLHFKQFSHKHGGIHKYFLTKLFGLPHKHSLPPKSSDPIHCICVAKVKNKKFFIIVTCNAKKVYTMHARLMPTSMIMGVIQFIPTLLKKIIFNIFKRKKIGGEISRGTLKAGVGAAAVTTVTGVALASSTTGSSSEVTKVTAEDVVHQYLNKPMEISSSPSTHFTDHQFIIKDTGGEMTLYRTEGTQNSNTISRMVEDETMKNAVSSSSIKISSLKSQITREQDMKIIEDADKTWENAENGLFEATFSDGQKIYYTKGNFDTALQTYNYKIIAFKKKFELEHTTFESKTPATEIYTFTPADLHDADLPIEAFQDFDDYVPTQTLRDAGYTAKQLYEVTTTGGEKGLVYSPEDLKEGGYTLVEMREAGVPASDLYADTWEFAGPANTQDGQIFYEVTKDDQGKYQLHKLDANGTPGANPLDKTAPFKMSVHKDPVTGAPEVTYEVGADDSVIKSNVEVSKLNSTNYQSARAEAASARAEADSAKTQAEDAKQAADSANAQAENARKAAESEDVSTGGPLTKQAAAKQGEADYLQGEADAAKKAADGLEKLAQNAENVRDAAIKTNNTNVEYITRCDFEIPGTGETYGYERGDDGVHYLIYKNERYTAKGTSAEGFIDTHTFTVGNNKEVTIQIDNAYTDTGNVVSDVGTTKITIKHELDHTHQNDRLDYTPEELAKAGYNEDQDGNSLDSLDDDTNQFFVAKILATVGLSTMLSQVLVVFFVICGIMFMLHRHDKKTDSSRYFTYRKLLKMLKTPQKVNSFLEKFDDKIYATRFVFEKPLDFCPINRKSLETHLRESVSDEQILIIGYSQSKNKVRSQSPRSPRRRISHYTRSSYSPRRRSSYSPRRRSSYSPRRRSSYSSRRRSSYSSR